MFEIGSSLREARLRQGRELEEIAAATMIRVRYLEALEQERFDVLPIGPYRASFLREYAEFLGLDGDLYVSEYELRIAPPEPEPIAPPPTRFGIDAARVLDRLPLRTLAVAAAVVVAFTVAVWQLGGSDGTKAIGSTSELQTTTGAAPPPQAAPTSVRPSPATLTLRAARGNCWLSVRVASAAGRVVYERTLRQGQVVRFGLRKALWIRVGAPWNLDAAIGGRRLTAALPTRTGDLVASKTGLRPSP